MRYLRFQVRQLPLGSKDFLMGASPTANDLISDTGNAVYTTRGWAFDCITTIEQASKPAESLSLRLTSVAFVFTSIP